MSVVALGPADAGAAIALWERVGDERQDPVVLGRRLDGRDASGASAPE